MRYQRALISGRRATGKSTLLWELQKRLNWPIFSISMFLRDYIRQYNLTPQQVDERRVEIAKDIDGRILNLLSSSNNVLIEAKVYGGIKKNLPGTAKILLTASDNTRYQRNAFREGISFDKAKKRVIKKETEWEQKMAKILGFNDFFDPKYYDLVVDTTNLTREQVADKVETWLKS